MIFKEKNKTFRCTVSQHKRFNPTLCAFQYINVFFLIDKTRQREQMKSKYFSKFILFIVSLVYEVSLRIICVRVAPVSLDHRLSHI